MEKIQKNLWTTKINTFYKYLLSHLQSRSLSPIYLGPSCCLEDLYFHTYSPKEISGINDFVFSPYEADLLLISGIITEKKIPHILETYEQIPPPKWIIALGDCVKVGGDEKSNYLDHYLNIDYYISGCPPKLEKIISVLEKLQSSIKEDIH